MCSEILIIEVRKMQGDKLKVVIGIGYVGSYIFWVFFTLNSSNNPSLIFVLVISLFLALMSGGVFHLAFHVVLEGKSNLSVTGKIITFFLVVGILGGILWGSMNGDPGP